MTAPFDPSELSDADLAAEIGRRRLDLAEATAILAQSMEMLSTGETDEHVVQENQEQVIQVSDILKNLSYEAADRFITLVEREGTLTMGVPHSDDAIHNALELLTLEEIDPGTKVLAWSQLASALMQREMIEMFTGIFGPMQELMDKVTPRLLKEIEAQYGEGLD